MTSAIREDPVPTAPPNPRGRDMTHVWAGRRRAALARRAQRAIVELESQGYTVIPPEEAAPAPSR
jgi:hypothetical protein